mgnify:FL=1
MIICGKYQHFKGNFYQVIHIAKHSENEEFMVVYFPLDKKDDDNKNNQDIWVRPLSMFDETIEREGKIQKRFAFVIKEI